MAETHQSGREGVQPMRRELLWHGARTWLTRRGDPISFVVLAAGFALAGWALLFRPHSNQSGYVLYLGAGSAMSLLAVRVAFWLVTSRSVRQVAVDLRQTPAGAGPWVCGTLLPVQAASLAVLVPPVAWVLFHNPTYMHGYRALVFVALWAGFIVSAMLDPLLAFGLVCRSGSPRVRSMQVALGLALLKPFPVMWFLDEAFRFGRGSGVEMILAGFLIVGAHAWLLVKSLGWVEALADEWAQGVEG